MKGYGIVFINPAGCEAKINEACINLTKKKQGNIVKTVWPHEQRMK